MKIVKKTLKGNLLGKTGFKKVAPGGRSPSRADAPEDPQAPAPEVAKPTRLKPRAQASLDALVKDDDVVVINEVLRPRSGKAIPIQRPGEAAAPSVQRDASGHEMRGPKPQQASIADPHVASTASEADADVEAAFALSGSPSRPSNRMEDRTTINLARRVLFDGLFRQFGKPGTRIDGHAGASFELAQAAGLARSPHSLLMPLPDGHVLPHDADLVVELDNGAVLVVDIASSGDSMTVLKARAFDAAHLLRLPGCFSVQLFIRSESGGMAQELAEDLGHDYDHLQGIDEADVSLDGKHAPLRTRIGTWIDAARAAPPRPR